MPEPFARLMKLGKRISFLLISESGRHKVYRCVYRARARSYGTIKYYHKMDKYVYYPTTGITLSPEKMEDIVKFLAEVNTDG